jgi:hypothetical protein
MFLTSFKMFPISFKVFSHSTSLRRKYTKMTILALKKKNVRVVGMGVCLPLRVTEVTILALKKKNIRVVGMGVCLPLRVTAVTIRGSSLIS